MKQKTIKGRIFYSYAVLLIFILFLFLVSINLYMKVILNRNASDALSQFVFSISEQLDSENNSLYNFVVNTSSSTSLRSYFFETNDDDISIKTNEGNITDLILSIAGPMYRFHRLILRRYDGLIYEYSPREIEFSKQDSKILNSEYLNKTKNNKGIPFFRGTFKDNTTPLFKDLPVISVNIAFSEVFGNKYINTIEGQQTYETYANIVEQSMNAAQKGGYRYYIYIYDEQGNVVYPFRSNSENEISKSYWGQINDNNEIYVNYISDEKFVGKYYKSDFTSWTTLVLSRTSEIMKPIYRFTLVSSIFVLILLIILLLISYSISNSITVPLQKIKNSIHDYNLNNETKVNPLETSNDFDELTSLSTTFYHMQKRIDEYVSELITVKTHDLQSQFSALQSQMNPHFIYNSISLISIMCEEEGNYDVVDFCQGLTSLLRYSSTNYLCNVTVKDEVDNANTYLKLLQKRYDGLLDIDVSLPIELYTIEIPKLVLQPLVENCIKYGLESIPPWFISIEGTITEDGWSIIISDTGNGFSSDILRNIQNKINNIDVNNSIPDLEPNGMGIINVYIRLKIYYKSKLHFQIGNQSEGGAYIQIKVKYRGNNEKNTNN